MVVEGGRGSAGQCAGAQSCSATGIEGRDVRLAIRHPQALELILAQRSGEIDVTGIVEPGRTWRLIVRRPVAGRRSLVRMIDRSDAVSAEKMRVDFVANASHELRTPLSTVLGYAETLADGKRPSGRAALELRPHDPRRGAAHASDHRGSDEPVAHRGRPVRRARRARSAWRRLSEAALANRPWPQPPASASSRRMLAARLPACPRRPRPARPSARQSHRQRSALRLRQARGT